MSIGYITMIDDLGRVRIPKDIRKSLGIKENSALDITVEGNKVCFSLSDTKENANNQSKDLVYICSPLRADTEDGIRQNILKAKEYARKISQEYNCRAIAPHSFLPLYLDDSIPAERELGLKFGLELIKACKKLYICGGKISEGMAKEILFAGEYGIPFEEYPDNL